MSSDDELDMREHFAHCGNSVCTYATTKMEWKGHGMHSIIGNWKLTLMELESFQWVLKNFSNQKFLKQYIPSLQKNVANM